MRLLFASLLALLATGCTHDFSIFDPADAAPATDGSASDAGGGDASDGGGGGDGGLVFQCGTGTVSGCDQCNGMPQPCVFCQFGSPSVLAGTCVAVGASCMTAPNGFARCPCNTPSACPESYQVCRQGSCRTCSESQFNNGSMCAGGGTCNSADGGCN